MVRRTRRSLPVSHTYSRRDAKDELRRVVREDLVDPLSPRRLDGAPGLEEHPARRPPRNRLVLAQAAEDRVALVSESRAVVQARSQLRTGIERYTEALDGRAEPAARAAEPPARTGLWGRVRRWFGRG